MKNENKVKLITVAAAGALFAVMGLDNTLTVADYTIRNEKIQKPVSIAFLSDIHSQKFKKNGEEFLSTVSSLNADVILFGGDIFDKHSSEKELARTFELVKKIKEINENCFFVLGNHDLDCKRDTKLKEEVAEMGINVFENGSCVVESKSGQQILIGGTDYVHCDNDIPEDDKALEAKKELIAKCEETGLFSVLLRHVPMKTEGDEKIDLILSGHNHGGLWRFPHTNAGVAGGGKKIFPRYAHGEYKNGKSTMIVGSGITTETYLLPRLYNVPEIVNVILLPELKIQK
ncbi:MAG: metallophosphoesterase [Clostridia bacterium]|nr:metallophosphoesterase [Clostridia bacterium]